MSQVTLTHDDHKTTLGFWIYIMTDLILFGSLFATYAVIHQNTYGGPSGKDIFELPFILVETMVLLTSSFTAGLAVLAARYNKLAQVKLWLITTFVLGATFLTLELIEFGALIADGATWQTSGFLTSYFTLVGTHGAHILVGLLWLSFMLVKVWRRGIDRRNLRRLTLFSLFWHFLDVVWIFIFSMVYLMGALGI